jgi:hypothetical protein
MCFKLSRIVFLAGVLVSSAAALEAQTRGAVERFTATATNISNAGEPVSIDLIRWSTDAERDRLMSVLAWYGEKEMAGAMPTIGYVWTSESAGYSVRYAYRIAAADGTQRIVLMTDRRVGGSPQSWKPVGAAATEDYPFTVFEIRLNKAGQGEGKASITNKLTVDAAAKTIAIENYSAAPVILSKVSRTSK